MNDPYTDPKLQGQLLTLAYRMLGSWHDAEDAVAEGNLRWQQLEEEQRDAVRTPAAWLTRVVSRICLDHLKSARVQREQARGVWLPEPRVGNPPWGTTGRESDDPADSVTLDETVSYAFLAALERLTPAERVSFILHDVFATPFPEVANIVGRTPDACRQLAVSARRRLQSEPRERLPETVRDAVVSAFLDACRGGNIEALVALLDPGVCSVADGGRSVPVATRPLTGALPVARYLVGVFDGVRRKLGETVHFGVETVNGRSGITFRDADRLIGVMDLSVVEGVVTAIRIQADPDKLG